MINAAIITVSDKGSKGERVDAIGAVGNLEVNLTAIPNGVAILKGHDSECARKEA